jgi:hypothetical protein
MPDADPPTPQETRFKPSIQDIDGLESFDDEPDPAPRTTTASAPSVQPATPRSPASATSERRSFSVFWPIVLICAGAYLLLSNMGYLPDLSWDILWRLWPLFLIGMGIDALIGRHSALGAVVATLLILALVGGVVLFLLYGPQLSNLQLDPAGELAAITRAIPPGFLARQ